MSADIKFLGKTIHADVVPASDIEFSHMRFGFDMDGPSEVAVNGGILQGTCKQAALLLLEKLTTWKRPPAPAVADPEKECARGFHCRENAEALENSKPEVAVKLYNSACEDDDEDACVRGADISMGMSPDGHGEHAARARVMLDMACQRELARACAASGKIQLIPLEAGKLASDYQRAEALESYLRACDLGLRDACAAAAPLVKGTPFAEAAPLLTGSGPIKTKTMGMLFALRWGQWTKFENGQPTMWITRRPQKLPEGALVTEFSIDKLPKGVVAPSGVETVYALALEGGHGGIDTPCLHCMPSGRPTVKFMMPSLDCVCALAPKN
jgi:hypothetical protein